MEMDLKTLLGAFGMISAICTMFYHIWKVKKIFGEEREAFKAEILKEVRQDEISLRMELGNKMNAIQMDIENTKDNIDKDFEHLRETYSAEMKNLSSKIEVLRDEIRAGHGSMVSLLTALVEKRPTRR